MSVHHRDDDDDRPPTYRVNPTTLPAMVRMRRSLRERDHEVEVQKEITSILLGQVRQLTRERDQARVSLYALRDERRSQLRRAA